jgi:hypothetical protein
MPVDWERLRSQPNRWPRWSAALFDAPEQGRLEAGARVSAARRCSGDQDQSASWICTAAATMRRSSSPTRTTSP